MNKIVLSFVALVGFALQSSSQEIAPYIEIGKSKNSIQQVSEDVLTALRENSFTILGTYNPSNKNSLKVIVFTRPDIKNTVVKVADRGALAAALKIGLVQKNDIVSISYTNPDYFFRAYLRDSYDQNKFTFDKFSKDLRTAFASVGNDFTPFGGALEADKLKKYHYKIMMPYFTDPVTLNEFSSFEEGLRVIEANLKAGKGETLQVYKILYTDEKVAVFGVGLRSKEDGEAHFLPIIGEDHIAAMPYEIILQGKTATMLHGKYRIALSWPDLTMGTFMKIMSTPGDIEDTLEGLCIMSESDKNSL
ncbi:hypothetical protein [uncultured Eudoraea sp.]|jgi:hypothetical protein|uniref:hypothetical protein n=1 Tax=uncultured Eudoraea sp. TaxID=1035614 RepID=UPI0026263665|nr:hypothetical protein [uncultured Eudoraea sp.]